MASCSVCGDSGRVPGGLAAVAGRTIEIYRECECRADAAADAAEERAASRIIGAGIPALFLPAEWDGFDEAKQSAAVKVVKTWVAGLALDGGGNPAVTTRRMRWCFLAGAPGPGKTHLSAIAAAEAARAGRNVLWRSFPDILPTGGGRDFEPELSRCRAIDVLVYVDCCVR